MSERELNFEPTSPIQPTNPEPTMSNISVFAFDSSAVRVIRRDGEPWFVAADLCQVLGISNNRDAVSRLDDDERGVATTDTPSGQQEMTIINESGLYSLILTSRKPEAKRFKKWVTSEVLPSIRKTGGYQGPNAAQQFPTQDNQLFLSHRADIFVAADRSFRAAMRSGRSAGLKMPQALRQANQIALEKTGVDMLAELRAEDHVADLENRQAHGKHDRPNQSGAFYRAAPLSAACFWGDWHSGLLGLPYQSCLSEQVYRAYAHWCKMTGEHYPLQHGQFTQALIGHCQNKGVPAEMRVVRLEATLAKPLPTMGRMLLLSQPPSEALGAWATELVVQFEKHLQQYCEK